ncbi:flagellar filament capping protein FliD [Pseudobacteroides cellulosolvens]|uniref:Flagellar hook-associated protein 2 n=1 Tax=Pseudobacteroides cellulosolvens ATCC 35603 = DSM 2933 TaxID=398512 RepID=A0A0L6JRZ5_9FIRM|nr:flagellar filament capping protein FliD [Pseudobacteroides cellulosolvens]KNY28611.1 flagellar hook-associated 2 domain-containing protein [Pseudobacteroides cellulosolvens ATCC 35603 = DSM 2933]
MALNSISGSNFTSNKLRLTGLATGLDTDTIISGLMKSEKVPLDKIMQKKQLAEWKRDSYREVTNLLRGFKDEFFDVLKPSTNILSQAGLKKFTATSSESSIVTATGSAEAQAGEHKITVTKLATAASKTSGGTVTRPMESDAVITSSDIANASGKKIKVTLDGVTKEIRLGSYTESTTMAQFASDIENTIGNEFGGGKVRVNVTGSGNNKLTFTTEAGASRLTLTSPESGDGLTSLHISSGTSNRLNVSDTLASLKGKLKDSFQYTQSSNGSQNVTFTINSKTFTFSSSDTLSTVLNTISNDTDAKVKIVYDDITDKFTINAKSLGAGNNINIGDLSGTFLNSMNLTDSKPGQDAIVVLDGKSITRSSNKITSNGVTYDLIKESTEEQTISLKTDTDAVFNNIKNFVTKYNSLIENLNGKLTEKHNRDYQPLTEDQKAELSEDQIKKWEEKAKSGLLKNDSYVTKVVTSMRTALYDSVSGITTRLTDVGITTGSYSDKGKLIIDEEKLKQAIESNPDGVMNLFSKKSDSQPYYTRNLSALDKKARYNEEGLAHRMYDIIEDNISTIRDSEGKKGFLLQVAGISGDASEYSNTIYTQISQYNIQIDSLADKLIDKENKYYEKYAALEAAMSKMNDQSNWLMSQFGNSGG